MSCGQLCQHHALAQPKLSIRLHGSSEPKIWDHIHQDLSKPQQFTEINSLFQSIPVFWVSSASRVEITAMVPGAATAGASRAAQRLPRHGLAAHPALGASPEARGLLQQTHRCAAHVQAGGTCNSQTLINKKIYPQHRFLMFAPGAPD